MGRALNCLCIVSYALLADAVPAHVTPPVTQLPTKDAKGAPETGCYDGVAVWENRADFRHAYVDAHNVYRQRVGLPPLRASLLLEKNAQDHVQGLYDHKCTFEPMPDQRKDEPDLIRYVGCTDPKGCAYGENGWSRPDCPSHHEQAYMYANWTHVVGAWWHEVRHYWYGPLNNGCTHDVNRSTAHFTQVAWEHSLYVGCAQVFCPEHKRILAFCHYGPAGNVVGLRPFSFKVAERIAKVYGRGMITQNPHYPDCDTLASKGEVFDLTEWRYISAGHADEVLRRFKAKERVQAGRTHRDRSHNPKHTATSSSSGSSAASHDAATKSHASSETASSSTDTHLHHAAPMYDETLQHEKSARHGKKLPHAA